MSPQTVITSYIIAPSLLVLRSFFTLLRLLSSSVTRTKTVQPDSLSFNPHASGQTPSLSSCPATPAIFPRFTQSRERKKNAKILLATNKGGTSLMATEGDCISKALDEIHYSKFILIAFLCGECDPGKNGSLLISTVLALQFFRCRRRKKGLKC